VSTGKSRASSLLRYNYISSDDSSLSLGLLCPACVMYLCMYSHSQHSGGELELGVATRNTKPASLRDAGFATLEVALGSASPGPCVVALCARVWLCEDFY